jgi:hypothetical protein
MENISVNCLTKIFSYIDDNSTFIKKYKKHKKLILGHNINEFMFVKYILPYERININKIPNINEFKIKMTKLQLKYNNSLKNIFMATKQTHFILINEFIKNNTEVYFLHDKFNKSECVYISYDDDLNSVLNFNLPNYVTCIIMNFFGVYHIINFPSYLKHLYFSNGYLLKKINNIPDNLVELKLPEYFNNIIKYPTNLIYLEYGYLYNSVINNLPSSLTCLKFGHSFNQNVDNLPYNLIHLIFGKSFNLNVDKLPKTLINVMFGEDFNKSINNLPNSINFLTFGEKFKQTIIKLPKSLKELTIYNDINISKTILVDLDKLIKIKIINPTCKEKILFNFKNISKKNKFIKNTLYIYL